MKRTCLLAVVMLATAAQSAYADRGLWIIRWRVQPRPVVIDDTRPPEWDPHNVGAPPPMSIEEPRQQALLAWNGREEILVLVTDLKASHQAQVLEVLPLPSEPKVDKGDQEVCARAMELIQSKQPRREPSMPTAGAPGGEVTQQKKIGAHNISVTRARDNAEFVNWVEGYLQQQGIAAPRIPETMKRTIGEYLRAGYSWFVFDVVEVGNETATHDAIEYRFKTDYLYYPLKITRDAAGESDIRLIVATPQVLTRFEGLPKSAFIQPLAPVVINAAEMRQLDEDIADLFRANPSVYLRYWQLGGRLADFKADVIVRP